MAAEAAASRPTMANAVPDALKNAALTGLVMLGLCFPIVAWETQQNMASQLTLVSRWGLVAAFVAVTFAGRFAYLMWRAMPRERRQAIAPRAQLSDSVKQRIALVGLLLLIFYPFLALAAAGPAGSIKWIDNYGTQILIYILLAWGLNIVVGLAGLLDLGYVAFYAVGAYTAALLSKNFGVSFWLCLPLAGIFAAMYGLMIGFPVLRLRGDYLAIVTLAFAEIVQRVAVNWVPVTGGYAGISGIPRPTIFGYSLSPGPDSLPSLLGLAPSPLYRVIFLFYLVLILALLVNWVAMRLRRLPLGRAWEAMREDEIACRSLGINTVTTKLSAFATGAFFGGIAGPLFAARQGIVSPSSFVFMESAIILAIVVLGGLGSQLGVAIAAVVMIGGTELLRELGWLKQIFGPEFDPGKYRMLIFGLAMVVLMIVRPRGFITHREPTIRLGGQVERQA
jgi:branched-chain amino acid transport system permease protein